MCRDRSSVGVNIIARLAWMERWQPTTTEDTILCFCVNAIRNNGEGQHMGIPPRVPLFCQQQPVTRSPGGRGLLRGRWKPRAEQACGVGCAPGIGRSVASVLPDPQAAAVTAELPVSQPLEDGQQARAVLRQVSKLQIVSLIQMTFVLIITVWVELSVAALQTLALLTSHSLSQSTSISFWGDNIFHLHIHSFPRVLWPGIISVCGSCRVHPIPQLQGMSRVSGGQL